MQLDTKESIVKFISEADSRITSVGYERISRTSVRKAARNISYDYRAIVGNSSYRVVSVGIDRVHRIYLEVGIHFSWIPVLRFGEPAYTGENLTSATCMLSHNLSERVEAELRALDGTLPISCEQATDLVLRLTESTLSDVASLEHPDALLRAFPASVLLADVKRIASGRGLTLAEMQALRTLRILPTWTNSSLATLAVGLAYTAVHAGSADLGHAYLDVLTAFPSRFHRADWRDHVEAIRCGLARLSSS